METGVGIADSTFPVGVRDGFGDADDRYRLLVDHSPDAICVHQYGRVVYINPVGVRWMAADSRDRLLGLPIVELVDADSVPPMLERLSTLLRRGDSTRPTELRLRRLDGTLLDVEAVAVRIEWEGAPAVQVVFRDLTAQKAAQAALRYQAALVNHVSDAIIATTDDGIVTTWNPAAEAIYGRSADAVVSLPISRAVGADLDPAAVVAAGGVVHATHRAADGSRRVVRVSAARMGDGYVLLCCDQTALRRAEQYFRTVVTSLDEGVVVLRRDGTPESANPAARRILGLPEDDPIEAMRVTDIPAYDAQGRPLAAEDRPTTRALLDGTPTSGEVYGIDRPDGRRVWLSMSCCLLNPADPEHSAVLVSFSDITARHNANARLQYEATHDPLTGLLNRTQIVSSVDDALAGRATAAPAELSAVMFIDLNNLKTVNDCHGHDAGDAMIRMAAHRLQAGLRSSDLIGRLGGDEFVALLYGPIDRAGLEQLAARLHETLAEPFVIAGTTHRISASIGVTELRPGDARDVAAILRDADLAMYRAKAGGLGTAYA